MHGVGDDLWALRRPRQRHRPGRAGARPGRAAGGVPEGVPRGRRVLLQGAGARRPRAPRGPLLRPRARRGALRAGGAADAERAAAGRAPARELRRRAGGGRGRGGGAGRAPGRRGRARALRGAGPPGPAGASSGSSPSVAAGAAARRGVEAAEAASCRAAGAGQARGRFPALAARRMLSELEDPTGTSHLPEHAAVTGVHACGRRTDFCIEAAIRVGGPVAVLPCCHGPAPKAVPRGVRQALGGALARDVGRSYRLQEAGYEVDWEALPAAVTAENRLLLGVPRVSMDRKSTGQLFSTQCGSAALPGKNLDTKWSPAVAPVAPAAALAAGAAAALAEGEGELAGARATAGASFARRAAVEATASPVDCARDWAAEPRGPTVPNQALRAAVRARRAAGLGLNAGSLRGQAGGRLGRAMNATDGSVNAKRANIGGHRDDVDISVRVDDTGPCAADVEGQELQEVLCTTDSQGHHHLFGKTLGGQLGQLHSSPKLRHVSGHCSRGSEPLAGPVSAEEVGICGVVHGASPDPPPPPDPIVLGDDGTAAFRVMSFNVWRDGGRSLERTIEVIRTLRPDIVGLQEASEATVQRIARDAGLNYYALGRQGVVSRFPLECIFDDHYGGGVVAVHAPVEGRAEPFILRHANVHLEPYPYPPYELRAEGRSAGEAIRVEATTQLPILAAVLSHLCSCSTGPRPPLLLTGDFNCASHLDYGAEYAAPCSALCAAAGLVDTYAEANPTHLGAWRHGVHDAPGITWAALPEEEPKKIWDRIDFVYADRGSLATEKITDF
ncbi:unnamed protein product [Prorocentrum cordatum]|uniref:Endonuclease/exonuclease/phosphatase domain-containing protein n=1 Tax=Prorocentrum cordatum TaxID=2364126 RepID=A0ABN9X6I1_9DINO|nr:unnamed protein product [Polarella glacialis]